MRGELILTVLSVSSSYIRNVEHDAAPANAPPDTVQWWLAASGCWRVRTFGLDHDIHVHSLGGEVLPDMAAENTRRHYADVIAAEHRLLIEDASDAQAVGRLLKLNGVGGFWESAAPQFAFWKPDDSRYQSKSKPRE